ncbi:hypothetical protein H2198_008830 [Neophaeococcomyces mojaviensis]|uniref:Uncharacterized protein n=1 Tax=Neophaeococcomyces mojaviensis TaxID=3383035 RepID=A0ACC2ZW90_9EURO|nr:hypothetical protein H2198_008830 [Knufia sp. JES_112]
MSIPTTRVHEWIRDGFIISTDPALIDVKAVNAAFASDQLAWAKALPEDELKTMLERSVCFGLYSPTAPGLPTPDPANEYTDSAGPTGQQGPVGTLHEIAGHVQSPQPASASSAREQEQGVTSDKPAMIGLARLITDCVTVVWLTDVYVLPEWQGQGLGSWLNRCVKEWVDMMPNLRRLSLIAAEGRLEQSYAKIFGTQKMEDEGTGYRIYSAKGRGGQV